MNGVYIFFISQSPMFLRCTDFFDMYVSVTSGDLAIFLNFYRIMCIFVITGRNNLKFSKLETSASHEIT